MSDGQRVNTAVADHKRIMDSLLELPACTLVTTGRTGTDFLQSLLDSHPEVLTFNGSLFFQSFWNSSVCVKAGAPNPGDLIDEFIGKHIEKLKSRYDLIERKHQLGDNFDQSLDVDLDTFRTETASLLKGREINSKNALVAIYAAYATCMVESLGKKRLFFHHAHHFEELPQFLRDFPNCKIICMTRDPRANFVSGIEHHRSNNNLVGDTDNGAHLYFYIHRILHDATPLAKYGNQYRAIRIEDLGNPSVIQELCRWLGINNDHSLTKSTWGGLSWHGDSLSNANKESGWSRAVLENQWEKRLSFTDKYVLNYIMYYRLKHYGYSHRRIGVIDTLLVPFMILLPLSYELRFASPSYVGEALRKGEYKKLAQNLFYYLKRVALFFKFYVKVTKREKFNQPFLTAQQQQAGSKPV